MLTSAPRGDALHQFIGYLKVNFATSSSSFPPSMWAGVLDQTIKHITNGCESFHRHFGRGNINPHPSVFDWLSEVSRSHKTAMIRANARRPVRRLQNRENELRDKLTQIKNAYESRSIDSMSFVKTISIAMLPASKRAKSKRAEGVVRSIKKRYIRQVKYLLNRR